MEFQRSGENYEDLKEERINQALNRRKNNIIKIIFEKRKIPSIQENISIQHKPQNEEVERQKSLETNNINMENNAIDKKEIIEPTEIEKNLSHNQGTADFRKDEPKTNFNKALFNFENFNLKIFLSKINLLKDTDNYKIKGPYIYCAVVRKINIDNNETNQKLKKIEENFSEFLYSLHLYHAGIFECTKKLIIHYGEEENGIKKPLSLESKNENEISEYWVYKYFYSKDSPEKLINLIDKNDWTSERYSLPFHNCIHCTNEYLLLNNISPIAFGPFVNGGNIAYPYLCDKCLKDLGRYKMYIKTEKIFNFQKVFFNFSGDNFETVNNVFNKEDYMEYSYRCQKCFDNQGEWKYNNSWLKKSEEENEKILIYENEWIKMIGKAINNFDKVGEPLDDLLIINKS